MNDTNLSQLATTRFDGLRAEADRQRIARAAKPQQGSASTQPRETRRFGLSAFMRRALA